MTRENNNIIRIINTKRYINEFKKLIKDDDSVENIIDTLSILNAQTLVRGAMANEDEERKSIVSFSEFFMKEYGYREDILNAIIENWDGEMPRILKIAEAILEEEEFEQCLQEYENMNELKRKKLNILIDFIWNMRYQRDIIAIIGEDDTYDLSLKKNIFREELDRFKNSLIYLVMKVNKFGGTLILNKIDKEKMYVCGWMIGGGQIFTITRQSLKDALEIEEDGKRVTRKNVIYEEITV